ncbi:MAG: hypothetical protein SGILL_001565, partial [Bacillariaceae sp.]
MSSDFSWTQQVVLAVVPKVTASLSIIGSLWIFIEVVTQKSKRQNVYNRLLCAMSFFDICTAAWMFASTWPIPVGAEGVAFASGNRLTCDVQGFFIQLGTTPPLYNTFLALYYLLVIKYSVTEETLHRHIEPIMHLFAISFGTCTAIAAQQMDLFNNANLWCWIAAYPEGCKGEECVRGGDAGTYRWAFYFVPVWICLVVVSFMMVMIYRTVRQRELKSINASIVAGGDHRRSSLIQQPHPRGSFVFRNAMLGNSLRSSIASTEQCPAQEHPKTQRRSGRRSQNSMASRRSSAETRRSSFVMPKTMAAMFKQAADADPTDNSRHSGNDANYVLKTIQALPSAKAQAVEMNSFGSRVVFMQSVLYTCAFYATYLFATLNRLVQQFTGKTYFPIILLHCIFIPLQGFFN